jgi:hypothetical protein
LNTGPNLRNAGLPYKIGEQQQPEHGKENSETRQLSISGLVCVANHGNCLILTGLIRGSRRGRWFFFQVVQALCKTVKY